MAGVEFGDSELFQQLDDTLPTPSHIRFTDDEHGPEDTCHLRSRLGECEETTRSLMEENEGLKRKLSIFNRPSGIIVENVKIDGPLLQILYANNSISKQCRQEIEDSICSVIQKHQTQGNQNSSSFQMKPQNSTFVMEEDEKVKTSSGIKTITEAFNVVGSVLYFTTFCVDKLGQPLLNENPQLTEGWEVPTYQQVFNQVISLDGQEIEVKDKRPKSICFNCGSGSHLLRDCPKPKDMAAINERRKEFSQGNNQINLSNQRYHADEVEERFAKYKPGVMSEELLTALGVGVNTLPPLIYRMRQLGYPPGWLKEAEMENSGLTLYDGNASRDGNSTEDTNGQKLSYDVSKLVDFPGFNVPAPQRTKDEYMQHGSVPMQCNHMKHNFAAYLSNNFPLPDATCNKRQNESDSPHQEIKRRRSSPDRSSDMDVDSDSATPRRYQSSGGFQFQPPLPPGSPSFGSPPPLPQGTPPATPTPPPLPKGTPPPTPTNGSPALSGRTWGGTEETGSALEDGLTLEELEEQQRLLWAALENADTATNSDSETPAIGTPVPSSPSVSTPAHIDTETEMEDGEAEGETDTKGSAAAACHHSENQRRHELSIKVENNGSESSGPVKAQEDIPQSPGPVKAQEDIPQSPGPIKAQENSPQSPGPVKAQEDIPQSPGPIKAQENSPQSPGPIKAQEDSPEGPGPKKAQEDSPESPGPNKAQEDSPQSPGPVKANEDSPQSPEASTHGDLDGKSPMSVRKVSAVPHRSKFAAGIVPFEDTPEFTEVAEATGTYLRIRDLLKTSPRNLARFKK